MRLEVFFDVICPWCYLGRHRLARALARRPDTALEVRWRPFQLNPGMPSAGMHREAYLSAKFGTPEKAARIYRAAAEALHRDGIPFNFAGIGRTPNTLNAHRLISWAVRQGMPAEAAIDRLFQAYFVEGADIGSPAMLADLASDIGLIAPDVRAYLETTRDADAIAAQDGRARLLGIDAVPTFVIDRRYAISGAQEPETLLPLLDLASQSEHAAAG